PTAGGRNLNHMTQRSRWGPVSRGPLSLTAAAILPRESRNRDSPLQFEKLVGQDGILRTDCQSVLSSSPHTRRADAIGPQDSILPHNGAISASTDASPYPRSGRET